MAIRFSSVADHSREALRIVVERHTQNGWGVLRVADASGLFLGLAGLQPVRNELPVAPATEAVWRLRREAWGHGYVCEAMAAVLQVANEHVVPLGIVALIARENERSANTAIRLGFQYEPGADFDHPLLEQGHLLRPHHTFRLPSRGV